MPALLLRRSDVRRNVQALHLLAELREAFRADAVARNVAPQQARGFLHTEGSSVVRFPGSVPGIPAYSVLTQTRFPKADGGAQGLLTLHDLSSGELLAVMESSQLGELCAATVSALGCDVLARKESSRIAFVGLAPHSSVHLKSLRLVRTLTQVSAFDRDPVRAEEFATRMYNALSLPVHPVASVVEAVEGADIVVMTSGAHQPRMLSEWLRPGAHVTLTADDGRCELPADFLERCTFVCDHRGLAQASLTGGSAEELIDAELGEVLAGMKPGRTSEREITAFSAVGIPLQDLVAAWHVYQGAREDPEVARFEFGD